MEIIKNENLAFYTFEAEKELEKAGLTAEYLALLGSTNAEIEANIKANFEFSKPESKLTVERLLTENEIAEARAQNLDIIENIIPEKEAELMQVELQAKEMVRTAKSLYNSYIAQSKELATYVRSGVEEVNIDPQNVFRIIYNGFYLWLLVLDNDVKIVKVRNVPEDELNKWYNSSDADKSRIFFESASMKEAK